MAYSIRDIPAGEAGTDITLKELGRLVAESARRPFVRLKALSILREAGISGRNHYDAAEALFNWVRSNIRYVNDPVNVETVQSPEVTLSLKAGDCDDHSALMAALSLNIGITPRFRVVGLSRERFQHIYPELFIGGRWIPADTTETSTFGRSPLSMPENKFYSFSGVPSMSNLGCRSCAPAISGGLGQGNLQIDRSGLINLVYKATWNTITDNWRQGIINRGDLKSYLRVIDEGNSPYHGTFADVGMRQAIADFLGHIEGNQVRSLKPESITSLQGMDGFLSSIVKAVGGVVKGAVNIVTGGGQKPVEIKLPDVVVKATAPPESVKSGVEQFLTSPVALAAIGVLVFVLAKK